MKNLKLSTTIVALIIAISGSFAHVMAPTSGYTKINGNIYGPLTVDGNFDCTAGTTIVCTITVDGQHGSAYNSAANASAQGMTGLLRRN